jgi:hypothetical protein
MPGKKILEREKEEKYLYEKIITKAVNKILAFQKSHLSTQKR